MLKSYQKTIIELMIKQELLIARLYGLFGDRFPSHADFWYGLAKEEQGHAKLIKKLYEAESKGQVVFNEGKIKTYTLNIYIDYIQDIIDRTQNDEFDLKGAANQALNLEAALIEKNFLSHFDIVEQKYKGVMVKLESETNKHIKRVRELIASL